MYSINRGGLRNEHLIGIKLRQLVVNKHIAKFKKESTGIYF